LFSATHALAPVAVTAGKLRVPRPARSTFSDRAAKLEVAPANEATKAPPMLSVIDNSCAQPATLVMAGVVAARCSVSNKAARSPDQYLWTISAGLSPDGFARCVANANAARPIAFVRSTSDGTSGREEGRVARADRIPPSYGGGSFKDE